MGNTETIAGVLRKLSTHAERSMVIVMADQFYNSLERLLSKYFGPRQASNPKEERMEDIFSQNGALGNFRAKIDISQRLGLIDDVLASALTVVRKLRNDFAHDTNWDASFETQSHKSRLVALQRIVDGSASIKRILSEHRSKSTLSDGVTFNVIAAYIFQAIERTTQNLHRTKRVPPDFITD